MAGLYVRHGSGDEELYDLSRDPHQLHNLMAELPLRTPVIATREWLRRWTEALASCKGTTCRAVEDQGPPGAATAVDP